MNNQDMDQQPPGHNFVVSANDGRQRFSLLPTKAEVIESLKLFTMILLGGVLLLPLMVRMPLLGWDWYYFFNANHLADNIYSLASPFFPYTKYFINMLTWMDWRHSLALLGGLTFMAIALGAWRSGGRYGSVALSLLTPLPLFTLWVGHPDGLALIGLLTGFIPLALIKPQVTFWAFLRSWRAALWAFVVVALILLIWPYWLGNISGITWDHSASFGWHALGWPVLLMGVIMMLGVGNEPWRLMAAGCFFSPDLMPYHLVVLLPAIGRVEGRSKIFVWFSAWLVFLGLGLGGYYRTLNLIFPLSIYLSLQTASGYRQNLTNYLHFPGTVYSKVMGWVRQQKRDRVEG